MNMKASNDLVICTQHQLNKVWLCLAKQKLDLQIYKKAQ